MTKLKKIVLCVLTMTLSLTGLSLSVKAEQKLVNFALDAVPYVSVVTDDNGAKRGAVNINDGNKTNASYWDSGPNAGAYATLDFKEVKSLEKIVVYNFTGKVWQKPYDRVYKYELYTSVDGETWRMVAQKTSDNIAVAEGDTHNLPETIQARYVKLVSLGGNSADPNIFHLVELEAYGYVEVEENIALNKPVTGPGNVSNITDGNKANFADLGEAPASFVVDLKDYYDINKVIAYPFFSGRVYKYDIYSSVDGVTFDKIAEKQDEETSTSAGKSFAFKNELIARYIKVTMTYNSANPSVHMNELEVFGKKKDGYVPPTKPVVDPGDPDNIAYQKPTRANMSKEASKLVVDGSLGSSWRSESFPANVDIDLEKNYNLDEILLYFPQAPNRYYQYTVYTSTDGINFDRVAQKRNHELADADGDTVQIGGKEARIIRVSVEFCSDGSSAFLSEVRVHGKQNANPVTTREELSIPKFEDSKYAKEITAQDTINEIYQLVERLLGPGYQNYFSFELTPSVDGKDYYEISDKDGKIHISGNEGVTITAGLNYYLKYFCNVHISQQNEQIATMPAPNNVIPVGKTIRKDTSMETRYAYNYCTNQYTNAFFGTEEWQREIDWMALNGINLVLDISGLEAVWVDYLQKMGYTTDDAKAWLTGPSYYAWQFMSNMENYGGPISDQYVLDKLELARRNQYQMRLLGMKPVLQGYAGMLPSDYADIVKDKPEFKNYADALIPQGTWGGGFTRPFMFDPRSELFRDCAEKFYESQERALGKSSNYYAIDPFHEGGKRPPGLTDQQTSNEVLAAMLKYDDTAVWTIQSWENNPTKGLLDGLGPNKEDHALVLDLSATTDPRYNSSSWGKEFYGTPWVYCLLDNFGQRPGVHGELDTISNLPSIINDKNYKYMKGIGITPEGMWMNPVTYDMFFETIWEKENINTEEWIKNYITRRYGSYSEDAYEGWKLLLDTAYSSPIDNHRGGYNARANYRPDRNGAILGQTTKIPYNPKEYERAVEYILKDYDKLQNSEAYLYDVATLLKQLLQNSQLRYYNNFMGATPNSEQFNLNSDAFLKSILLVDDLSATQEDELLGNWIGKANDRTVNYDDFSKDTFEIQAKTLITTWGARASAKILDDYAYRQYAGYERDYVYPRWEKYIEARKTGGNITFDQYFNDNFDFVLNNKEYTRVPTDAKVELKKLSKEIMENYRAYNVDIKVIDDNVAVLGDGTSSNGETHPITNMFDNNPSTLWVARNAKTPVTATLDLDKVYDVYKVQILFEDGPNSPTAKGNHTTYNIEVYNASTKAWEEVYAGSTVDGIVGTKLFPDLIKTNKVRVNITAIGGSAWPAIAELQVFSSNGVKVKEGSNLVIENKVLSSIDKGTSVQSIKENLQANVGDIKIVRDGNTLNDTDVVQLGDKVVLTVENGIKVDELDIVFNIDKTGLEALVKKAKEINTANYTQATVQTLELAITKSNDILANSTSQKEVDDMVVALQSAIDGLVIKELDKTELSAMIDKASKIQLDKYTEASVEGFSKVLLEAKTVLTNATTQGEIDKAVTDLGAAIDSLVLKDKGGDISYRTLIDESGKVTVSGNMRNDVTLKVTKYENVKDLSKKIKNNEYLKTNELLSGYKIELWKDGKLYQIEQPLKVRISLDDDIKDKKLQLSNISNEGAVLSLASSVKDGAIEFFIDSSSDYAISTAIDLVKPNENTNTGVSNSMIVYISLFAISGIAIVVYKKRKKRV